MLPTWLRDLSWKGQILPQNPKLIFESDERERKAAKRNEKINKESRGSI